MILPSASASEPSSITVPVPKWSWPWVSRIGPCGFFPTGICAIAEDHAHQAIITLYRALTTYNDSEQVEGENLAAAISYGGLSIAVAVIVARALEGEFAGWIPALTGFGMLVATAFGLYPIRQLVVQGLLLGGKPSLRGGVLDESVGRDRNVAAAALEAACYLGTALAIMVLA